MQDCVMEGEVGPVCVRSRAEMAGILFDQAPESQGRHGSIGDLEHRNWTQRSIRFLHFIGHCWAGLVLTVRESLLYGVCDALRMSSHVIRVESFISRPVFRQVDVLRLNKT